MKHPVKNLIACTTGNREGITIIEVLTSLVVAAIGVSGVLVLIPFAVRQSQLGIERDLADVVGINASEEIQMRGFTSVFDDGSLPWAGGLVTTEVSGGGDYIASGPATPVQASALNPRVIHLDPYALTTTLQQRSELGLTGNTGGFPTARLQPTPDILSRYLDNDLKIPVMNFLRLTNGNPLGLTEAQMLTQSSDELVFSNVDFRNVEAQETDGPQPFFTVSPGGNPVTRQFQGGVSWSAVMVPEKGTGVLPQLPGVATAASRFRMYTLVYADRNPRYSESIDVENGNDMLVAHVPRFRFIPDRNIPDVSLRRNSSPNPMNLNGGFVESVSRIVLDPNEHLQADGARIPGVTEVNIVKDDWVMLVNRMLPIPNSGPLTRTITDNGVDYHFDVEEPGYDLQVAFCRVVSVDQGDGVRNASLTVEGGPFDFYYDGFNGAGHADPNTDILPTLPNDYTSATYVVHLKDVINVFERTITLE